MPLSDSMRHYQIIYKKYTPYKFKYPYHMKRNLFMYQFIFIISINISVELRYSHLKIISLDQCDVLRGINSREAYELSTLS